MEGLHAFTFIIYNIKDTEEGSSVVTDEERDLKPPHLLGTHCPPRNLNSAVHKFPKTVLLWFLWRFYQTDTTFSSQGILARQ